MSFVVCFTFCLQTQRWRTICPAVTSNLRCCFVLFCFVLFCFVSCCVLLVGCVLFELFYSLDRSVPPPPSRSLFHPLVLFWTTYLVCSPFATGSHRVLPLSPDLPVSTTRYRSHEANWSLPPDRSTSQTQATVDPSGAGDKHETCRSAVTLGTGWTMPSRTDVKTSTAVAWAPPWSESNELHSSWVTEKDRISRGLVWEGGFVDEDEDEDDGDGGR